MDTDFKTFRDHFLSVYQSAMTDIARQMDDDPEGSSRKVRAGLQRSALSTLPGAAAEIAGRYLARTQGGILPNKVTRNERALAPGDHAQICADLAFRYMKARITGNVAESRQVANEFVGGVCDPGWLKTIDEYLKYFAVDGGRKEIPYRRAASVGPRVIELPAGASVALVGDWGTGAQPAFDVLQQIAELRPNILVHLGDIYYSGTPVECELNFSEPISRIMRSQNRDVRVYTLSGNHDMYCGGVGYYDLIDRLNPEPFTQPASYFCLRSADKQWQLLAMDTGLHDYDPLGINEATTFVEDDELACTVTA